MSHEEATQRLLQLEQGLEQLSLQKKQFRTQLAEAEAALTATEQAREAYRIIGNLMIKQPAATIKKELDEKQETLRVRIATIEKQEGKLRTQLKEAQETAMQQKKKK